jgi:ABC-2 type transport system ATP-binding protein
MLEISHLTKNYGAIRALDNVSLKIRKGIIFGLLGPNGAGKSTLIRLITRILFPDAGEIRLEGSILSSSHIKYIGYMPEERGLYKKMRVAEHLLYLARLKGYSKKEAHTKVLYWLNKFDILSWEKKNIEDLSKGMQQKIQFIAAVIAQPTLLILDEPFTGLDPINADLLKDEIIALKDNGTTIIFSTHRMESVDELCDEIALIHKGKIILEGNTKTIRQQFKDNTLKVTFAHVNEKLPVLPKEVQYIKHQNETYFFKIDNELKINTFLDFLIKNNFQILGVEVVLPSIHEIFVNAINQHHA